MLEIDPRETFQEPTVSKAELVTAPLMPEVTQRETVQPAYQDREKLEFSQWLLTPPSEREIKNLEDYAEASGISRTTLWRWKNTDPLVLKELEKWRATIKSHFHEVSQNMLSAATSTARDRVAAARLLAELTDEVGPQRLEITGKMGLFEFLGASAKELPSGDTSD